LKKKYSAIVKGSREIQMIIKVQPQETAANHGIVAWRIHFKLVGTTYLFASLRFS